jgi:IS5 family transposase
MQTSFSSFEYAGKKKQTRRDRFLADMEVLIPWATLEEVIEPYYPKATGRGRPPIGLTRMLRMYLVQHFFSLSDEGVEDAVYDSQAIRGFIGIDLAIESAPDATTLLQFRRLLEKHDLQKKIFDAVNANFAERGVLLKEGTIVDATIIAAPSSTRNKSGERDPEMHQTKKGNQWYFGMKAHIGIDASSGLVHTLEGTAANVSDVAMTHKLMHGQEQIVLGDAGYQGVEKREENQDKKVSWHVAMRHGKRAALPDDDMGKQTEALEKTKASIRAKVEHPFQVIKNLLGHRKARYKGLAKNTAHLHTLFTLANLLLAQWHVARLRAQIVP